MKGIEKIIFFLIAVIIVVVVLVVYYIFGGYIINFFFPKVKSTFYISELCPEWVQNRCTDASATDISIDVDKVPTTLLALCTDAHKDKTNPLDGCRQDCKGCP